MKPQFRLFLWLTLVALTVYGGITLLAGAYPVTDVKTCSGLSPGDSGGYQLSPQEKNASFHYTSSVAGRVLTELLATEGENDFNNQFQLKKHHPALFNYFAGFYSAGSVYARRLQSHLSGDADAFRPSVRRYIALRVIRI
jgi:hypothetical protein